MEAVTFEDDTLRLNKYRMVKTTHGRIEMMMVRDHQHRQVQIKQTVERRFEGAHLRNRLHRARRWLRKNGHLEVKAAPRHIREGLMCLHVLRQRKGEA